MNLILHSEYRTLEYFMWNLSNGIDNPITRILQNNAFSIKVSSLINDRSLVMKVQVSNDKTWFLKQAANLGAIKTIKNEAAFYESIKGSTVLVAQPNFVYYDTVYDILILEFVENHQSLSSLIQKATDVTKLEKLNILVTKIAKLLVLYHKEILKKQPAAFPYSIPIIKNGLTELTPNNIINIESLALTNVAYNKLFEPYSKKIIEGLNALWEDNAMIHFDFRPDNILVNQEKASVFLTDWEMVSLGDSLWDVVTFFSQTLCRITNNNIIKRYNGRRADIKTINKIFFDAYLQESCLEKNDALKHKLKIFWQAKHLSNYLRNDLCEVDGVNCFETAINNLVDDLW